MEWGGGVGRGGVVGEGGWGRGAVGLLGGTSTVNLSRLKCVESTPAQRTKLSGYQAPADVMQPTRGVYRKFCE